MYILIIKSITIFLSITILSIGSCTMHRNHLVLSAINNGSDPVATRLAATNDFPAYHATLMVMMNKDWYQLVELINLFAK